MQLQQRVEANPAGRALISGFLAFLLLGLLVSNLPPSRIHSYEQDVFAPFLNATGLRQRWGVFAPNPTRRTVFVGAEIEYADGSIESWQFPGSEKLFGAYRGYHWRMLSQDAQSPNYSRTLWPWLASWVLRTHAERERQPVSVTLLRTTSRTPAPGSDDERVWEQEPYYRLVLRSATEDGS